MSKPHYPIFTPLFECQVSIQTTEVPRSKFQSITKNFIIFHINYLLIFFCHILTEIYFIIRNKKSKEKMKKIKSSYDEDTFGKMIETDNKNSGNI